MNKFTRRQFEQIPEGTIEGNVAIGCGGGFFVDGSSDLTLKGNATWGCDVSVSGDDTTNLHIEDHKIDGALLEEIYGDFQVLTVISAKELYYMGQRLSEMHPMERKRALKISKIGKILKDNHISEWALVIDLLIKLASAFGD